MRKVLGLSMQSTGNGPESHSVRAACPEMQHASTDCMQDQVLAYKARRVDSAEIQPQWEVRGRYPPGSAGAKGGM